MSTAIVTSSATPIYWAPVVCQENVQGTSGLHPNLQAPSDTWQMRKKWLPEVIILDSKVLEWKNQVWVILLHNWLQYKDSWNVFGDLNGLSCHFPSLNEQRASLLFM